MENEIKGSGLMKAISIHGKEYYEVKERVMEFHRIYPNGSIRTDIEEVSEKRFITRSIAIPDIEKPERYFVGLAYENIGKGIMSTSALECCETSSVGRALGFLDIGIVHGIASADEVRNAIGGQEDKLLSEKQVNWIMKECVKKKIENIRWNSNETPAKFGQELVDLICKGKPTQEQADKLFDKINQSITIKE